MYYLAEFYLPGDADLAEVARRARLAGPPGAGLDASLIRLIFVLEDENCFAVYEAASAGDVLAAGRRAGLVFDRVVAAVLGS